MTNPERSTEPWLIQEYVNGWLVGKEQPRAGLGPPPEHGPWWFRSEDDARRLQDYLNSLEAIANWEYEGLVKPGATGKTEGAA